MTRELDHASALRELCLAPRPEVGALAPLGVDASAFWVYRRMVRARLRETLAWGLSELVELAGEPAFDGWMDEFLAHAPPRSPFLRDLPGEMLGFVASRWDAWRGAPGVPAHALDAARLGWTRREVEAWPERDDAAALDPLTMDRPACLSATVRRLRLDHAVHRAPGHVAEATRLCVYRAPSTHEVKTLELSELGADVLDAIAAPHASLADALRAVAARHGGVDAAFVGTAGDLVADLVERGALLGSAPAPSEANARS